METIPTFLNSLSISSAAVLQMALVALLGYLFVKRNWLKQATLSDITRLLIDGIVPCTFMVSMTRGLNAQMFKHSYLIPITVLVWILCAYLLCRLWFWRLPADKASEDRAATAMTIVHNSLYLPLPVALAVTPQAVHDEITIYIAMATFPSMVIQWTLGVNLLSGLASPSLKERVRLVVNLPLIGFFLGIGFSMLPGFPEAAQGSAEASFIVKLIFSAMSFVGTALSPLAMIMLGAFIASTSLRGKIKARHVIPLIGIKLLGIPFVIVLLLRSHMVSVPTLGALVLILEAGAPPATNHSLVARRYNGEWELVSSLQLVVHAVAMISLPLWLALALKFYG